MGPGRNNDQNLPVPAASHPGPPPATALPIPNPNMTNAIDSKTNVLKMMLGVSHGAATSEAETVRTSGL